MASANGTVVAGWWQGNGMVCVNRSLKRQGNGMGTAWYCESAFTVLFSPALSLSPCFRTTSTNEILLRDQVSHSHKTHKLTVLYICTSVYNIELLTISAKTARFSTSHRQSRTADNWRAIGHNGSCAYVSLNTPWSPTLHTVFQNNTTIHMYLQLRSQYGSRNQLGPSSFSHASAEREYLVK
jgi:hypothetical protein